MNEDETKKVDDNASADANKVEVIRCPKCGQNNEKERKFCGKCGYRLHEDTPEQKEENTNVVKKPTHTNVVVNHSTNNLNRPVTPKPISTNVNKASTNNTNKTEQPIKCPNCGSTQIGFVTYQASQNFSKKKACCGGAMCGPIGALIMGHEKAQPARTVRKCKRCGHEF